MGRRISARDGASLTVIAVTLCTFRRPEVAETLQSLQAQSLPQDTKLRIIVADNDDTPSGRDAVLTSAQEGPWSIEYVHAPARNISVARNAGLVAAGDADWIAFLDDDETAEPDWIACLLKTVEDGSADAVFGPSVAEYDADAPGWIQDGDYHSNRPVENGGQVITGHTCNALLRWRGTEWRDVRFDIARGQSGGEDTAFFMVVHQRGAQMALCPEAIVREPVAPQRLSFRWIAKRKFRSGQSFSVSAQGGTKRVWLILTASAKAGLCAAMAVLTSPSQARRNAWALRGILHAGVIAGCLNVAQKALYGALDNAS